MLIASAHARGDHRLRQFSCGTMEEPSFWVQLVGKSRGSLYRRVKRVRRTGTTRSASWMKGSCPKHGSDLRIEGSRKGEKRTPTGRLTSWEREGETSPCERKARASLRGSLCRHRRKLARPRIQRRHPASRQSIGKAANEPADPIRVQRKKTRL